MFAGLMIEGMENFADLLTFFGRFHTLAVHLPIGFLFFAILLEVLTRWPAFRKHESLLPFIWLSGAVTVWIAVALGYMLSLTGGYNEQSLAWHKWAGIALGFFSFLCYFYKRNRSSSGKKHVRTINAALVILTGFLLIQTGHLGGTLTHGSDYLVEYAPAPIRKLVGMSGKEKPLRQRITSVDSADIFADAVMPIIDAKCASCHNEKKKKGQLVLTSFNDMLEGGETAPAIVPGNLARSEIYRRITLPEDHDDFMPGEGKAPLSEDQISIIEWWIEKNAPRQAPIGTLSPTEGMLTVFEDFFGLNSRQELHVPPANAGAVESLLQQGFDVRRLTSASNILEVKMKLDSSSGHDFAALLAIREQLVWLDLGDCAITDNDLIPIGQLSNLVKLDLHGNNISDSGVPHLLGLSRLESLNLYDTKVTDKSVMLLARLEGLRRLYVWKTRVGNVAIADTLRKTKPQLKVIYDLPFRPQYDSLAN